MAARAPTANNGALVTIAGGASVVVALFLVGLKFWAWRTTDSVALLGTLADSLLDLFASLVTLFAVRTALTPADSEHRFGHGKAEGVAGLAQAVIVTLSALFVAIRAVERLLEPGPIEELDIGLAVMAAALAITLVLVAFQQYVVRRTGSLAIRADSVHYQADLLTNLAVLLALILSARFGWYIADPLLALAIVAIILASVWQIGRQALDVLLDRELDPGVRRRIREIAKAHPAVRGVHDIRTRSSGTEEFIQFHLELDPALPLIDAHRIMEEVEARVRQSHPSAQVLIHADPHGYAEPRDPF